MPVTACGALKGTAPPQPLPAHRPQRHSQRVSHSKVTPTFMSHKYDDGASPTKQKLVNILKTLDKTNAKRISLSCSGKTSVL